MLQNTQRLTLIAPIFWIVISGPGRDFPPITYWWFMFLQFSKKNDTIKMLILLMFDSNHDTWHVNHQISRRTKSISSLWFQLFHHHPLYFYHYLSFFNVIFEFLVDCSCLRSLPLKTYHLASIICILAWHVTTSSEWVIWSHYNLYWRIHHWIPFLHVLKPSPKSWNRLDTTVWFSSSHISWCDFYPLVYFGWLVECLLLFMTQM